MVSPTDNRDKPETTDTVPTSKPERTSLEVARGILKSLKYELSHGGTVDEATVHEIEEKLAELEGQSNTPADK